MAFSRGKRSQSRSLKALPALPVLHFCNISEICLQMIATNRRITPRPLIAGTTVVGDTGMSKPVYYVQECPTCGRRLQIRVVYLGKRVVCQHCLAEFDATDPSNKQLEPSDSSRDLMLRAEELLASVGRQQEFHD
jgi:hypothetical protein